MTMNSRMIKNCTIMAMTVLLSGCHVLPWSTQRQAAVGPPLPMTVSRDDLVSHLNQQSGNLKAWQCTSVKLSARMPGARGMPPMYGSIACESPNRFHLTASNLLASADMGANSDHCWFRSTPGHDGVISWRHADAHLLQEFPSQVPYIDPDWLMLVLGVKQLDPADYVLEPGDNPQQKELWLTSVRDTPGSGVYRYVIKVSTKQRVVVEHAAFDQDHRTIVRARLSDHRWFDGHLIPRTVHIDLPGNGTELTLSFNRIDTNPNIDTAMFQVPRVPNGDNVDLGDLIRQQRNMGSLHAWNTAPEPPNASLGTPQFDQPNGRPDNPPQTAEFPPDWSTDSTPQEPDWADSAGSGSLRNVGYEKPPRRRFLGLIPAFW